MCLKVCVIGMYIYLHASMYVSIVMKTKPYLIRITFGVGCTYSLVQCPSMADITTWQLGVYRGCRRVVVAAELE